MEKPAARRLRGRALLAAAGAIAVIVRRLGISPVSVEGDSMMPTLPAGALVAVSPLRRSPGLGAVVVVRRPNGVEHLKRVIAVAGDRFRDSHGRILTLAEDQYAVAGDNRSSSTDSRHYGLVAKADVAAVARFCYWPPRAWKRLPGGSRL